MRMWTFGAAMIAACAALACGGDANRETTGSANQQANTNTNQPVAATITGMVWTTGGCAFSPLSGATVTLSGPASRTAVVDAQGNFQFDGLGAGTYVLTPSLDPWTFYPSSATVTVDVAGVVTYPAGWERQVGALDLHGFGTTPPSAFTGETTGADGC